MLRTHEWTRDSETVEGVAVYDVNGEHVLVAEDEHGAALVELDAPDVGETLSEAAERLLGTTVRLVASEDEYGDPSAEYRIDDWTIDTREPSAHESAAYGRARYVGGIGAGQTHGIEE